MSSTPFWDTAKKIAAHKSYVMMSADSAEARSHGWWKNLVEYGPWKGPGSTRVSPPDREALPGIAKLFGTSTDRVAEMIAADWYGVHPDVEVSPRVLQLGPVLDQLQERDAQLVEELVGRLVAASRAHRDAVAVAAGSGRRVFKRSGVAGRASGPIVSR